MNMGKAIIPDGQAKVISLSFKPTQNNNSYVK